VEALVLFGLLLGFFGTFMTMPVLLNGHPENWQRLIPLGFAVLFVISVAATMVLRWMTRPEQADEQMKKAPMAPFVMRAGM
jgi:hypothetical protein